jgi:hypothetical protein
VAARLSDLAGADQILVTDVVIANLPPANGLRFRSMGPMEIRGRAEPCVIFRVEWQDEVATDFLTMPGVLDPAATKKADAGSQRIALSSLDASKSFTVAQLPALMGRDPEAHFIMQDQRVSRVHARIIWRQGQFVLEDVSSYGTWVRFTGNDNVIALRRQDCMLHDTGEIALGAPFEDFSVPTISFKFSN